MSWLVPILAAAGFLAWFFCLPLVVKSVREKRRDSPQGGMVGAFDEIFHPAAHQAQEIWQASTEMPAPAPLPGDKPLRNGKITIVVPDRRDPAPPTERLSRD